MRGSFLPISGSFRLSITAHGYLAIRVLPMIGRGQENDQVFVVDLVEDAPASDSDSPCRGLPIAQPRSRRDLTRSRSKERVDTVFQGRANSPGCGGTQAIEVLMKCPGLEETVFRQSGRAARPHPGVRSSNGAAGFDPN